MAPISAGNGPQKLAGNGREHPDLLEQWLAFITRNIHMYRLEDASHGRATADFKIKGLARSSDGFTLVRGMTQGGRCRISRGAAEIASDGQNRYAVYMSIRGGMEIAQFGRRQLVKPGSFTCVSTAAPAMHSKAQKSDMITFFMPHEFVAERVAHPEQICMRSHTGRNGLQSLIFDTLSAFARSGFNLDDETFERSARSIGDLVLLALNDRADLMSNDNAPRACNLSRAKRVIRQRMAEPDLTLSEIADEMGLSLRYLHELFRREGDGVTMREYLKIERLERARELLEMSSSRTSITDISLECGFANLSYFSTAFRRRYGCSPRDMQTSKHARV